jgi:K+ transporter
MEMLIPITITSIEAIEANPLRILPGKIMVFVIAAGIIIMVVTIWQKGISHDRKLLFEKDIEPRMVIRFTINVSAKNNARTTKPIAR